MKYMEPMKLYRGLLKPKKTGPLLGLTVTSKILATTKLSVDKVASQFHKLINRRSISGLVIGYPFDDKRKRRSAGVRVERFVDDLSKTGKLEDMTYTFWEGSFTSKIMFHKAKRSLKLDVVPPDPNLILDDFAAFEILQEYLDFVNQNQVQNFPGEER